MKILLLAVLCAACVPPDQAQYGQPGYGGQPGGQPGYAPQGPPPLACIPLLECLAGCGQNQACLPECMNRGDDASRAAVNTLMACNAATPNPQCEPELVACRAQTPVVAQPQPQQQWQQPEPQPAVAEQMLPGQPHTTANILPWLVGNWEGNNYHYTFTADGQVKRASGVPLYTEKTGRYACASIVNEMGTVHQEGDLLIMQFAAAQENHCGDTSSAPALTVRNRIVWYQYNGPVELKLLDIDCTRGVMYCSDPIRRR